VHAPGGEARCGHRASPRLRPLVEALAAGLRPHLKRSFAFFGHGLGALVAFDLARRLQRDGGPQPVRLFVSGCPAPQGRTREKSVHTLPDAEFREERRCLRGTPAAVLDDDELMDLLLPTL